MRSEDCRLRIISENYIQFSTSQIQIKSTDCRYQSQQTVINKLKMAQFKLWFAYYDSLFLNADPKLSSQFYKDHIILEATWPSVACPNLARAFQLLQSFINNSDNWLKSQLQRQQLQKIEDQIDNLMHLILLEKSYAFMFWDRDYRRIEASTVHFYTFLQLLIKAIIPYPTMTIFQCKSANKLCVQISKLQKLMNQILKCINPMAKFLSDPKFSQQSKLILNFFQNWVFFMKKLPNIKKNKLNHIHNLVKFINLTNPIQICTTNKSQQYQGIRKKSNTVGTKLEQRSYPNSTCLRQISPKKKRKRRSSSCIQFFHNLIQGMSYLKKQKKQKLFKFPEKIMKYAADQQLRKKTVSLESLISLQNKVSSISKNKTLTTNETTNRTSRLNSINQQDKKKRLKAKSSFQKKREQKSLGKRASNNTISITSQVRSKTKFYQQQLQRDSQKMSIRSERQSTIRKRENSIMSVSNRQVKKDGTVFYHQEATFSIKEGVIRKSKWDIVRSYVWEKIYIRKLKSILQQ